MAGLSLSFLKLAGQRSRNSLKSLNCVQFTKKLLFIDRSLATVREKVGGLLPVI
jgi:hypothetical protein